MDGVGELSKDDLALKRQKQIWSEIRDRSKKYVYVNVNTRVLICVKSGIGTSSFF